ncbi:MAG: hypothetical protein KAI43_10065 [Candidatus Aureabacteria bacterium]|nr:hypothetical protein [Candidatus Auribacterota bacterium]
MNLRLYKWISAGNKRRISLIKVMNKPLTPSMICRKAKQYNQMLNLNSTSDVLAEFREQGVAICLNPEDKMGRLYELTEEAKEVRELILEE